MGMFSEWQKQEIDAIAFSEKAERKVYRFKRIMVEYAQMLHAGGKPEDFKRELNVWEQDVKNFHIEYPRFKDYLRDLTMAGTIASQINKNHLMMKLYLASEGQIELNTNQLNAIKLMLQVLGALGSGKGGKSEEPVTSFQIVEKGETK